MTKSKDNKIDKLMPVIRLTKSSTFFYEADGSETLKLGKGNDEDRNNNYTLEPLYPKLSKSPYSYGVITKKAIPASSCGDDLKNEQTNSDITTNNWFPRSPARSNEEYDYPFTNLSGNTTPDKSEI